MNGHFDSETEFAFNNGDYRELFEGDFEFDAGLEDGELRARTGFRRPAPSRPAFRRPAPRSRRPPRPAAQRPPRGRPQPRRPRPFPRRRPVPMFVGRRAAGQGSEFARWVQSTLNQVLGIQLAIDGVMGPATRSAIRDFQKREGLPVDGIVGPQTRDALIEAQGGGGTPSDQDQADTADSEYFDQELLGELTEEEWEDDEWDEEVDRASRAYIRWVQSSLNRLMGLKLAVDGIAGAQTSSAVRSFQKKFALTVDGVVGPQTEAMLVMLTATPPPQSTAAGGRRGPSAGVNTPLPQSGSGFYNKHGSNRRSYGLPETIQALVAIGRAWHKKYPNGPRIGIGDISFRGGGPMPPHKSHQKGVDIDIRLPRNDGKETPVRYQSSAYSRGRTQDLVNMIRANGILRVQYVFFNDPAVKGVQPQSGHDDHLHVRFFKP